MTHFSPSQGMESRMAPQFVPEEVLLQEALDIDLESTTPEIAIPPLEAAIVASNELEFVYLTWYEAGLSRNQQAINQGAATFVRFYETHVDAERRHQDQQLLRSGWAPGQVAAMGVRDLLLNKWARALLQSDPRVAGPRPEGHDWVVEYQALSEEADDRVRQLRARKELSLDRYFYA